MSWLALNDDAVLDELATSENATLKTIHGAVDKLPHVLQRGIDKFRGAITAGGQSLGAEGTLPKSLHDDCVAYVRWRFLTSIPQAKYMQTVERKDAYKEAIEVLASLRAGDFKVENEDEEEDPDAPGRGGTFGGQTAIPMRTDHPQT